MKITHRPLQIPVDLPVALDLADGSGLNIPHLADWPYRFSSWALDDLANTQAWFDGSGRMLGWAVMQIPFWAIDCLVHPDAPAGLYREILAWTQARVAAMAARGEGRPMWFISISAERRDRRRDLESLDFVDVSDDGENAWSKVLFELPEEVVLPGIDLPEGLRIRSLNAPSEVQAYVNIHRAVFRSESMTLAWRRKSTRMADYRNDLDLVAVADGGELVGFCVAWLRVLATGETVGQIEPLGVREGYRGRKLSRALMTEAIHRLKDHDAAHIYVETDRQREAAMAAYGSQGFRIAHDVLVYRYILPETV